MVTDCSELSSFIMGIINLGSLVCLCIVNGDNKAKQIKN